jgi:hypothetical protein
MATQPERKLAPRGHRAERGLLRQTWPPRLFQVALGLWLILTVFLWPHSRVQASLALGAGAMTVLLSLIAVKFSSIRILVGLVGVWLLLGSLVRPASAMTLVSNLLVALLILGFSFLPVGDTPLLRRRPMPSR